MKIPIVLNAFGASARAGQTYDFIDQIYKKRFPDHEIVWSWSSRTMAAKNPDRKMLAQVLDDLKQRGHVWAVVQSLHLMWGHEYFKLVQDACHANIRTSVGLPLFNSPDDYQGVAAALGGCFMESGQDAVVFVGHGTDHPCWVGYLAFQSFLTSQYGPRVFVGVLEGDYPARDHIIKKIQSAGIRHVRLVPLLLVAGFHYVKDLTGAQDSWKQAMEAAGITVEAEDIGLGKNHRIVDLFICHTEEALDVIPR